VNHPNPPLGHIPDTSKDSASHAKARALADEQIRHWRSVQTAAASLALLGRRGGGGGWKRVREVLIAKLLRERYEPASHDAGVPRRAGGRHDAP
jgi:hypothetical protein